MESPLLLPIPQKTTSERKARYLLKIRGFKKLFCLLFTCVCFMRRPQGRPGIGKMPPIQFVQQLLINIGMIEIHHFRNLPFEITPLLFAACHIQNARTSFLPRSLPHRPKQSTCLLRSLDTPCNILSLFYLRLSFP